VSAADIDEKKRRQSIVRIIPSSSLLSQQLWIGKSNASVISSHQSMLAYLDLSSVARGILCLEFREVPFYFI
jgi:hypothetical protein